MLHSVALAELLVCWIAWWYPFLFRAPHRQNRPSVTAILPTRIGLLLESAAFFVGFLFHLPYGSSLSPVRIVAAMLISPVAVWMAFASVRHLGRQFRIHAGLYHDHELVRTGPYAIVRHPIYSSLFGMLLANLLLISNGTGIAVGVAIFIAGTEIRVHTEDRLLAGRFGESFTDYRSRVRAYLPFVR